MQLFSLFSLCPFPMKGHGFCSAFQLHLHLLQDTQHKSLAAANAAAPWWGYCKRKLVNP